MKKRNIGIRRVYLVSLNMQGTDFDYDGQLHRKKDRYSEGIFRKK
ncbi:MAG: hypothetical protein [Olavius algarvensis Gamma 1 endosymbiont]|nr:MAG: hypothetical protein [Olavius algarvensis Gamma 1 endosymbiont]